MAKGYWMALVDVSDPESYKTYVAAIEDVFRTFGGRYVIRGGRNEVMEGKLRSRVVTVEFADYATALAATSRPNIRRSASCGRIARPPISWSSKAMTARSRQAGAA